MKINDKILFGLIIGIVFPSLFIFFAGLIWFYSGQTESNIPAFLLFGAILGLLIDIKYLNRLIKKRYTLPIWFVIAIYGFYHIAILGFFMGIPVVNSVLGMLAGFYYGKKIINQKPSVVEQKLLIKQVYIYSGIIMGMMCILSGSIALLDDSTGENLRFIFGNIITITKPIIWAIVLVGGTLLILFNQYITKKVLTKTLKSDKNL